MEEQGDNIKEGAYVIIQKHNYTKLHKITQKALVSVGKDQIDISNVIGKPYWSTFKMEPNLDAKRSYFVKVCEGTTSLSDEIIREVTSGSDNREITDDGSSQKLSTEDIVGMRDSGLSSHEIVGQLVENSKTFHNKTEYSQVKYLKKKEKKYCEYIIIRKPTIRLVADIIIRQGPPQTLGLRMDTLAQISSIVSVQCRGTYILYESGCQGLVAAELLNRIGTEGTLIHTHPLLTPQKQAILAMNFSQNQLNCLLTINIQTLFKKLSESEREENTLALDTETLENGTCGKTVVINDEVNDSVGVVQSNKRKSPEELYTGEHKKPRWEIDSEKAVAILKNTKCDGLVIVCREYPSNIFKFLIKYVGLSRSFVIYCPVREPLQEMYCELKARQDIVAIRLTESWLRLYQVLPDRTHPDVTVSGSGGYLLSGILVNMSSVS